MPYKDADKQKEYQLSWIKKRREDWIKENGPCRNCGSLENLEVDHVDPKEKKFNPREIWSRTEKVRQEELAKCQVLCGECHEEKTAKMFSKHGISSYRRGCRCEVCMEARQELSRRNSKQKLERLKR